LESAIRQGGRQTLLSLAQDDFLIDGGLMLPEELLNNPEREGELRDAVINAYMNMYENASNEGVGFFNRAKKIRNEGRGGRRGNGGSSNNGSSGNVNNVWANYGGVKTHVGTGLNVVKIDQMARAIADENTEAIFEFKTRNNPRKKKYVINKRSGRYYFVPLGEEPKDDGSNIVSLEDMGDYVPGLWDKITKYTVEGTELF
jgi:hypothetical protein